MYPLVDRLAKLSIKWAGRVFSSITLATMCRSSDGNWYINSVVEMEMKRKMVMQSVLLHLWCERVIIQNQCFLVCLFTEKMTADPIVVYGESANKKMYEWIVCPAVSFGFDVISDWECDTYVDESKKLVSYTQYRLFHWHEWWQLTNTPKKKSPFPMMWSLETLRHGHSGRSKYVIGKKYGPRYSCSDC